MAAGTKKKLTAVLIFLMLAVAFGFAFDALHTHYLRISYPRRFDNYAHAASIEYAVPEAIIYSVIRTESNFDEAAVSYAGAIGLMQLMPSTFSWLTDDILGEHLASEMISDPETNIRYGTALLSRLYNYYGNWETALAAYNAGMGTVNSWLEDDSISDESGKLIAIPYEETRKYVERITESIIIYEELYYSK